MNALILAGKKEAGRLESCKKLTNKALLKLNETPMIEYIVNALHGSKIVEKIVVVGPEQDLNTLLEKKVTKVLQSTDSILENVETGLEYLKDSNKILLLTSDIPLINGQIIDRFIEQCKDYDALFFYPIITRENIQKKYPEAVRSYFTLKEGTFCGGNIVIFNKLLFEKNKPLINELYENRKDVKKYIRLLGIKFLVKYLLKILTIDEIEKKAAQIVGYPVKSIIVEDPEIMIDLDKLSDYELILQTINQNTSHS